VDQPATVLTLTGPATGSPHRRKKPGGTQWTSHAWGVAVDTNTVYNPQGQASWNGTGWNGTNYNTAIPDIWQLNHPEIGYINFYWGINFSGLKDPHHFQYVTGY
jgi:hypothetical protein